MPRFQRYRVKKTYMKANERLKPGFLRPKRWFNTKEYKKTQKVKVFGLTASNGESIRTIPKPS